MPAWIKAFTEGHRPRLLLAAGDHSLTSNLFLGLQVALLLLVAFVPNIQIVRSGMTKEVVTFLVQFGLVPSENPSSLPGDNELATAKHYVWSLEGESIELWPCYYSHACTWKLPCR